MEIFSIFRDAWEDEPGSIRNRLVRKCSILSFIVYIGYTFWMLYVLIENISDTHIIGVLVFLFWLVFGLAIVCLCGMFGGVLATASLKAILTRFGIESYEPSTLRRFYEWLFCILILATSYLLIKVAFKS